MYYKLTYILLYYIYIYYITYKFKRKKYFVSAVKSYESFFFFISLYILLARQRVAIMNPYILVPFSPYREIYANKIQSVGRERRGLGIEGTCLIVGPK